MSASVLTLSTRAAYQTLLDAVALQPENADQPAIHYLALEADPITVTRAEFQHNARAYAAALTAVGIAPRDLVVIAHTQNLECIYAFWGALLIGAIPSMFPTLTEKLDPDIYMRGMAELVALSGVRVVLTTDEFAPELSARVTCPVYGSTALLAAPSGTLTAYTPNAAEIAFLQHSSGTTGLQKGVALSHDAVLNQLASYSDAIALTSADVIVSWLPLYHDMGLIAGFLMPLIQGVPLVLMSPFEWARSPAMLMRAIHDYRGTLTWLPNFAYNHCARRIRQRDTEGLDLASMRLFINCSEPVYAESHALFAERFAANGVVPDMLAVSYAMAENVFAVTQTPLNAQPALDVIDRIALESDLHAVPVPTYHAHAVTKVSCGAPIAGTQVRALDAHGAELPERQIGELVVSSDCMLTEYYRRPDLDPFVDGWYRTGDRGYIAGGEIYVIGRSKDLIINAGKNVYPQDIEAIVNGVAGVHPGRVVAFGVPDAREGTELIAVIAETDVTETDARKALSAAIRAAVAASSTVTLSYVELVDAKWLIKTSSGKIARGANREKWLTARGAS